MLHNVQSDDDLYGDNLIQRNGDILVFHSEQETEGGSIKSGLYES